MNKKIFFTSIIAIGFACPAIAEPSNTGEFPSGGLMQADYTYTNAATESNMAGVYEDIVYANAEYENMTFNVTAGNYLPAGTEAVATCTTGNFCPGISGDVYYSESSNQGITACSTLGDGSFTSSVAGASANTDCYKACNIANMGANGSIANIAHAATLTGNDYYGNGTDTCEPATCENGWHLKERLNLTNVISSNTGVGTAHISASGSFSETNNNGQSYYSINDNGAWAVDYGNSGILTGLGRCSSVSGDNNGYAWTNPTLHTTAELGTEGGQYCYCSITGYKSNNGTLQSLSSTWMFNFDNGANCATECAYNCASNMRGVDSGNLAFRSVLFGNTVVPSASCEANTITITWNGTTAEAISANNAGTVTYGGDIRTPQSASHVPGKNFTGWLFSTTAPSNGNE